MPQGASNAIRDTAAETCNLIPELVRCVTRQSSQRISLRIRLADFPSTG
jgi:hypothetical protein